MQWCYPIFDEILIKFPILGEYNRISSWQPALICPDLSDGFSIISNFWFYLDNGLPSDDVTK